MGTPTMGVPISLTVPPHAGVPAVVPEALAKSGKFYTAILAVIAMR
jgi:hypothetical protein